MLRSTTANEVVGGLGGTGVRKARPYGDRVGARLDRARHRESAEVRRGDPPHRLPRRPLCGHLAIDGFRAQRAQGRARPPVDRVG